jgi:peptidyl-prolyl cis-trans isomerase SurA
MSGKKTRSHPTTERMMTMVRTTCALFMAFALALFTLPAVAAVAVMVNGTPITDVQIAQRAKLIALEGGGGNKAATSQLVDEALMLEEAKRLGISISDAQVDGAVQSVARNLKLSVGNLEKMLTQKGVPISTLRDRLKASLAWQAAAQQVVKQDAISDLALDQQAAKQVTPALSYDYILKEILFVMPNGKGSPSSRTAQANQYRHSFKGCDSAVELSTKFTDAAVVDIGRRHATQLPEAVAKELAGLNVGGITKPRVVANGVSMLAVCSKAEARDLTFIKDDIKNETGGDQLKSAADKYLAELKKKANIVYN